MITPAETTKAKNRRLKEGWFEKYLQVPIIDIGCQRDPVHVTARRFDLIYGDGDATNMKDIPPQSFMTVYCSHILEHLLNPHLAVRNWWKILKPGGLLIIIVPHRDLFEKKKTLPSKWNLDHKTFWLPEKGENPHTIGLRQIITSTLEDFEIVDLRICDEGYVANGDHHPGGEYSIECIVKKLS